MRWFVSKPYLLHSELRELANNGNYSEVSTYVNRTLVSSGQVILRVGQVYRFPVLIVFEDATPYIPPKVYLLKSVICSDIVRNLSELSPVEIAGKIQGFIRFYYHRHQNSDGSLCIIENDDIHDDRLELIRTRDVIERIRQWFRGHLTGEFPPDNREVELYSHFPSKRDDLIFLLPDKFFSPEISKGKFYFHRLQMSHPTIKYYLGFRMYAIPENGIEYPINCKQNGHFFNTFTAPGSMDLIPNGGTYSHLISDGTVIEGWWWHVQNEPLPCALAEELIGVIDHENGLRQLAEQLMILGKLGQDNLCIGLRFFNRRAELEWQFFYLVKSGRLLLRSDYTLEDAIDSLRTREIQAIRSEQLTERYFHLRNSSRADRSLLANNVATVIGVGALGSVLAETLAKAGVGRVNLVDRGIMNAHNAIRHTCGLPWIGWPKVAAVGINSIAAHNPFVSVGINTLNILESSIEEYFDRLSIGISTIADDAAEHFLNEESIRTGRTVFYARALRGGKAARIFRVRPGIDACKQCLVLYKQEGSAHFITLNEDPDLPLLTNECNNPVRPGSGADMSVIGGVLSQLVIEYLQNTNTGYNQWIWYTEELHPRLPLKSDQSAVCFRQYIPPHPKCHLCQRLEARGVLITRESLAAVSAEVSKSIGIETGGILIGFRARNGKVVIVRATGPGPKAVRTPTWFDRDVEYCQQQLKEASDLLGLKGQYVGEWHFHPVGSSEPSGRDIRSMGEIAAQINYATDEPIMLIVSPETKMVFTLHPAYKAFIEAAFQVIDSGQVDAMECQVY